MKRVINKKRVVTKSKVTKCSYCGRIKKGGCCGYCASYQEV